jgi:AcrR family transcriptional regulator
MRQERQKSQLATPLPAKQARSRRTRDALLTAGRKLLAHHPWSDITINDIVKSAGVSVGSFYTRFKDKDAFFESLAAEWVVWRRDSRLEVLEGLTPRGDYFAEAILDTYQVTLAQQHFWRAALMRGAADPSFWASFRDLGLALIERVLQLREQELGRKLRAEEVRHIRFAFQMSNGLINNSIVNRPGPILPGTTEFETELVRGFKAVAGI